MRRIYDLHLPYFKQGDDLQEAMLESTREVLNIPHPGEITQEQVEEHCDHKRAFELHAQHLRDVASILDKMAEQTRHGLRIMNADVHYISVECDEKQGETLIGEGLISYDPVEDDLETDLEDEDDLDD